MVDSELSAGLYRLHWTARDEQDNRVPAGVYFCELEANTEKRVQKLLYLP